MKMKLFVLLTLFLTTRICPAASLDKQFQNPPAAARPWVYWFWNNGNVTSNGITADLEAMQRVGVGGVLIMDVVERFAPPRGTADFMNDEWRNLFQFSVQEAGRLGLEINMANGPGWCGSSGPWITVDQSMQMLVSTNVTVSGPANYSAPLPKPNSGIGKQQHDSFDSSINYADYYRDIAVLAFPVTADGVVPHASVVDLTAKLGADGKLEWSVPAGQWIIQRIGHTTTGSSTRPPVAGGNGLECDKLSAEAMDLHFTNMMHRLVQNAGPLAGKSLVATHIDSWEVGTQNWTPKMRAEFLKRRGYDPLPWLPCLLDEVREKTGNKTTTKFSHNFDGIDAANRFRWDFAETVSELLADNYSGRTAALAHQHKLRYSLEGYNLPFGDEYTFTARADEPMSEFWTQTSPGLNETWRKAVEMASVGHVYGHAVIGAEAFTSGDQEMWKLTPADIKALGDYEFSQGINRFVVHRYAHQPYLDRAPGATMGPWGLHYERTQTWWEMAGAWHEYLSRCQFLLRQGKFVADLCYLRPELPNQTYFTPNPAVPAGYRYDEISAEAVMQRMSVKSGRLVLPDGMSYRMLVLPDRSVMTPALAEKIQSLVSSGATVFGHKPRTSPSLQGFPQCDEVVARIGDQVWGDCDGKKVTEHRYGRGRVLYGQSFDAVVATLQVAPDFTSDANLNWIHRTAGDTEIYFVANPSASQVSVDCHFRVKDRAPELWNPQTGQRTTLAYFEPTKTGVRIPLVLGPSDSVFVVLRRPIGHFDPVVNLTHNGQPLVLPAPRPAIHIQKATYGVTGDAARTRDVTQNLDARVRNGSLTLTVSEMAQGDDPAFGVVKTLTVEFTVDGKSITLSGRDTDSLSLAAPTPPKAPAAELRRDARGRLQLIAREPGNYELKTARGATLTTKLSEPMAPMAVTGPWQLSFPPKWGAPESINLPGLISWSDSAEEGVRHFSGIATYRSSFGITASQFQSYGDRILLDLGEVKVMAHVKVNGHDCGVLWRAPFQVDVTDAVQPGENRLEIQVANLWPNRMIGDAALPVANRLTWSSYEPFKADTTLLRSGLLGPVTIQTQETINLQ